MPRFVLENVCWIRFYFALLFTKKSFSYPKYYCKKYSRRVCRLTRSILALFLAQFLAQWVAEYSHTLSDFCLFSSSCVSSLLFSSSLLNHKCFRSCPKTKWIGICFLETNRWKIGVRFVTMCICRCSTQAKWFRLLSTITSLNGNVECNKRKRNGSSRQNTSGWLNKKNLQDCLYGAERMNLTKLNGRPFEMQFPARFHHRTCYWVHSKPCSRLAWETPCASWIHYGQKVIHHP